MVVAIEVYFDPASEQLLCALQDALAANGVPAIPAHTDARPHVSLAVLSDASPDPFIPVAQTFAQEVHPFTLTLSHVGVFPGTEGVVFLAPTLTERLATLHRAFHQRLEQVNRPAHPYYRPDQWVPHCTIASNLIPSQIASAVQVILKGYKPIQVECTQIGVITGFPILSHGCFDFAR